MAFILTLSFLVFLLLILGGFLWYHLFFRGAFQPPGDSGDLEVSTIQGVPFLIENHLPYSGGIQSSDRPVLRLDGSWMFHTEDDPEPKPVNIPSCFNTADSPLRVYEGPVWYEREFTLPDWQEWKDGSLLRLAFYGSFYRTDVWLDGQSLGSHEGGYLPFYFDITNHVSAGKSHHLKVRVDNRIDVTSLPPRLFQGHNLGWHPFGGLHRSVSIELCPPVYCFKLQVDAETEADNGLVQVSALYHCTSGKSDAHQTVTLCLLAANGQILAQVDASIRWDDGGQFGISRHQFTVPAPRLWEPANPCLYRLEAKTGYERCETDFGFRTIQAGDGKLWLNGKPFLLRGACRHQEDRLNGLAQKTDSVQRELETIQSLHGNFVRLAHYPHSSETLELCDRMGLCAWVEIPLYQEGLGIIRFLFDKTKRDTGKTLRGLPGVIWDTKALGNSIPLGKARAELLKMIERDRNHPSVLFWGLGNECWTFNPAGVKALAWLREQAEAFDSKRLFTYAAFALPVLGPLYERSFEATDVVSINEYFGWYYGKAQDTGAYLRSLARKYPDKPLLVTETGSDTVRGEHSSEALPPRGYSEEYQVWYLEEQWRQMRNVPTFSGLSIWILKDFLCPEYREDNPVPFYNLKGLLDRDGQPKAALETVRRMYGKDR